MEKSAEVVEFSIVLNQIPIILVGEDGKKNSYTLRELTGGSRDQFMNKFRDKVEIGTDGKMVALKDFEGSQSALLAVCLYDANDDLVPEDVIQKFPTTPLGKLFALAQEISGMVVDEKTKSESKND